MSGWRRGSCGRSTEKLSGRPPCLDMNQPPQDTLKTEKRSVVSCTGPS